MLDIFIKYEKLNGELNFRVYTQPREVTKTETTKKECSKS
jgi:hypothetical protein